MTAPTRPDLVTFMQGELHLLLAVALYIRSPVAPISYHIGMPIWMVPWPLGDIVVCGVNVTISALEATVLPRMLVLELRLTELTGKVPC